LLLNYLHFNCSSRRKQSILFRTTMTYKEDFGKKEDEIELSPEPGFASALTPSAPAYASTYGTPISGETALDPETVALLQATDTYFIQQKLQWGEALTQGCWEQANKYTVTDKATEKNIFLVEEHSQTANRCCCAPTHSLFAKFYLLSEDGMTKKSEQAVMTMEREGCDCCFTGPCPKPMLCCFACKESCAERSQLYAGDIAGHPGVLKGARDRTPLLGEMIQPSGGGGFRPVMQLMDRDGKSQETQMFAAARGPCFFGGCSEFCCDSDFGISLARPGQSVKALQELPFGDFASIKKLKPKSFGGALRELFTDSDIYEVTFHSKDITPQQKANILASMIHLDYVFFERDNDMIYCEDNALHIVICNCFIYGCVCPCECVLSGTSDS
jgi:hypothetical protein